MAGRYRRRLPGGSAEGDREYWVQFDVVRGDTVLWFGVLQVEEAHASHGYRDVGTPGLTCEASIERSPCGHQRRSQGIVARSTLRRRDLGDHVMASEIVEHEMMVAVLLGN